MVLLFFIFSEWRISHVLSHHIYTNTVQDLEMSLLYPFIHWFPTIDKPFTVRLFPYLTPIIYPFIIPGQLAIRYFMSYKNNSIMLPINYHCTYINIVLELLSAIMTKPIFLCLLYLQH